MVARSRAELTGLLSGVELLDPGIVWTPQWRPDTGDAVVERPEEAEIYGAVGRVVH